MKKILLISTGGTIACKETKEGLLPMLSAEDILSYVPHIKRACCIEASFVCNTDSTNITPYHWGLMVKEIEKNYESYDGFVLCHGTDTLAYTASALSYMIQNSRKPIVITGSQKPITHSGTDAITNLSDSLLYASDEASQGVCVVFGGAVIKGTKARKNKSKSFDAFISLNYPQLADIKDGVITRHTEEEKICGVPSFYHEMSDKVCSLKLTPGMKPDIISFLFLKYDCILVEGFGVGGVPDYLEKALRAELEKGRKTGKGIVMTTQIPNEGTDMSLYEVGKRIKEDYEIAEAFDMTFEAALTKLMWILGNKCKRYEEIKEYLYED